MRSRWIILKKGKKITIVFIKLDNVLSSYRGYVQHAVVYIYTKSSYLFPYRIRHDFSLFSNISLICNLSDHLTTYSDGKKH